MRKLYSYTGIILLFCSTAFATPTSNHTLLLTGSTTNLSSTAVRYFAIQGEGEGGPSSTTNVNVVSPSDSVFTTMKIRLNGSPGTGKSYTFNLFAGGTPATTNLVCTIADLASECQSDRSVVVARTDQVYIKVTPSGTPTARAMDASLEVRSDTKGYTNYYFTGQRASQATQLSSAASSHYSIGGTGNDGTEFDREIIAPFSGEARNLHIRTSADIGFGKTYVATLLKNSSATSLTCTVLGGVSLTCNDLTNAPTFAAGDALVVKVVASTGAVAKTVSGGIVLDTKGTNLMLLSGSSDDTLLSGSFDQEHIWVEQGDDSWNGTAANRDIESLGRFRLKRLYVELTPAPDPFGGDSYTFGLVIGGSQRLSCAVTGNGTTCNDTTVSVNDFIYEGDNTYFQYITSDPGPTAATSVHWGIGVEYIRRIM